MTNFLASVHRKNEVANFLQSNQAGEVINGGSGIFKVTADHS